MRHREANEPCKFSCTVCSKMFKTRQTLKNHEDVHASFNRYQCSLCEKRFKLRKSCLAHIRVHHSEQERSAGISAGKVETPKPEEEEALLQEDQEGDQYVVTLEEEEDCAEEGQIAIVVECD